MLKTLFCSCVKDPISMAFDGEDADEKILYVFRKSFITNLDWMFVAFLLLITPNGVNSIWAFATAGTHQYIPLKLALVLELFWYLFTFGYIFVNFINWFFNVYIISNKRIFDLDFVGFLYRNISEAPLTSIEDVTSNIKGTLRVVFNYGSVFIQTAAEKREFEFIDVAKPANVRDIISDIVANLGGSE